MKKTAKGFVLIEAVVAMMVLAIGLLGVSKLQVAVVSEGAAAKARSEAMTIAQARIDTLRLIARQSEHYTITGGTCTAGSLVTSGTTSRTGINASFSEAWTVTVLCSPARHQIQVNVTWSDPKGTYGTQTVTLNSGIAWNDPVRNYPTLAGGSGTAGGLGSPTNVRLGDSLKDYDTQPGSKNGNKDGSSINYNSQTKEYELVVPMSSGSGYRVGLYSNVPIVRITGLVVLDPTTSPNYSVSIGSGNNDLRLSDISVYRTDITYCIYPLAFTNADDPKTYGTTDGNNEMQASTSSARTGAYVCYVPEGWAGNVGLLNYEKGNNGGPTYYACPDDVVESGNGNGATQTIFSGVRSHKVEIVNSSGVIVGQSGVLVGHQNMIMPNYNNLTRLSRLDFLVFRIPSGNGFAGCATRMPSAGNYGSGSDIVTMRTGAATNRSDTAYTPGVPSIRYSTYAVDRYVTASGVVNGGFVTVTGAYTGGGAGGCTSSNIRAVGSTSAFQCSISASSSSGTYSCAVSYGWSGSVGYWNGSALSPLPSSNNISAITASTTTGPSVTCP